MCILYNNDIIMSNDMDISLVFCNIYSKYQTFQMCLCAGEFTWQNLVTDTLTQVQYEQ